MDSYLHYYSIDPTVISSIRFDYQDDTGRIFCVLVGDSLAFSSGRFATIHFPLILAEFAIAADAEGGDANAATLLFDKLHFNIHNCISESLAIHYATQFIDVIRAREYSVWIRDYNDRGLGTQIFPLKLDSC